MTTEKKIEKVSVGSVKMTVRPWKHPAGHQYFRASYTDQEGRVRHITRANQADAVKAAKAKATEIHNGIVDLAELPMDKIRMIRAFLDLSPTWADLERWGAERPGKKITLATAIDQFMDSKLSAKGRTTRHLSLTEADLRRMADHIGAESPLESVKAAALSEWLDGLKMSPKRKKDYRAACVMLWRWASKQDLISVRGQYTEPEKIPVPEVTGKDKVRILSPEELRFVIGNIEREFLPWLVLAAFSGLRSGEIRHPAKQPLDWSAIKRDRKLIELPASIAKTRKRSLLPISPTLEAWLKFINPPKAGTIVEIVPSDKETSRLGKLMDRHFNRSEGWPINCLRHSFGSYRVAQTKDIAAVSLEMSNSVEMIKKHYLEATTESEAEAYFNVLPQNIARTIP